LDFFFLSFFLLRFHSPFPTFKKILKNPPPPPPPSSFV